MRFILSRSRLTVGLCCGMFSAAPVSSTYLPPQYLPVYGGAGGTAFTRTCGAGKVLTGVRFRGGVLVDAVGILCRPVLADGTLGPESTVGTIAGGSGGTSGIANCPTPRVAVGATIKHGTYVNYIHLWCRAWDPGTRKMVGDDQRTAEDAGTNASGGTSNTEKCEAATQPASGIRGRASSLLDAFGVTCNEP